jgi:hypothetical protein
MTTLSALLRDCRVFAYCGDSLCRLMRIVKLALLSKTHKWARTAPCCVFAA